jgi:hypothetical protein
MNKILACLFFILAINFHSYSRNEVCEFAIYNFTESDWKVEYKDSQIQIESKTIIYDSEKEGMKHERVVFRYTNLSNQNYFGSGNIRNYGITASLGLKYNFKRK